MKHTWITAIIVLTLGIALTGCASFVNYKTTKEPIAAVKNWPPSQKRKAQVLEIIKNNGESIVLSEESPGKIESRQVVALIPQKEEITIELSRVKKQSLRTSDNTMAVETTDGRYYVLKPFEVTDQAITGISTTLEYPIPFSEIGWLWIKRVSGRETTFWREVVHINIIFYLLLILTSV
jgi:hypothetical protein